MLRKEWRGRPKFVEVSPLEVGSGGASGGPDRRHPETGPGVWPQTIQDS